MPDSIRNNWEPNPRQVGKNWQDMFRDPQRDGQPPGQAAPPPPARDELLDEDGGALDLMEYKPWIVQRVRSRPALMLELRRYEPRSGMWQGWAMPYHCLCAIEYLGDRMLSLDFSARQFVICGQNIKSLVESVQKGEVLKIIEYSDVIWSLSSQNNKIDSIKQCK